MSMSGAAAQVSSPPETVGVRLPQDIGLLRQRIDRLRAAGRGQRVIVGIVGEPGAGKSTLAAELLQVTDEAVLVPMDGLHLANTELARLGRRDRKGAPDTFDADGFVQLVRRLRHQVEDVVYAPDFRRDLDEAVAGAIAVPRACPVVILEGNYLLLDDSPWNEVCDMLDESWYILVDDDVRLDRLTERHRSYGLPPDHAHDWARVQDEANARLIRRTRDRATLVVALS